MHVLDGLNVSPSAGRELSRLYTLERWLGWRVCTPYSLLPSTNYSPRLCQYTHPTGFLFLDPLTMFSDFYIFAGLISMKWRLILYLAFSWFLLKWTIYPYIIDHLYFCVCELSWNIYLPNFHWVVWLLFKKLISKNFYIFLTLTFCLYVLIFSQSITYLSIYCIFYDTEFLF